MGSYLFDGSNDHIQYPDAAALDALEIDEYLILVWSRPGTGGNTNGRIFQRCGNNSTAAEHMQLLIGNGQAGGRSSNFTARQRTTDVQNNVAVSGAVVPDEVWSCFGFSYRDLGNGQNIRLFEAGAAITPASTIEQVGSVVLNTVDPVTIGDSGTSSPRPYHGHVAWLGIWNIATLSDAEVDTLVADFFNSGSGTVNVPRQDVLVEFLRLNASGATTGDKSVLINPTVGGATFASGESAPVSYNALGGGTAALSGTALGGVTQDALKASDKTIRITLTGDTFVSN